MTQLHPIIASLRELRRERGVPQAALADRVGVCTHTISQGERGRSSTTLHILEAWAGALGKKLTLEDEGD